MSRASNSLKATDVTATPIKLKYSASYSNTTICDSGIYAQSGINGPVTITGSVPGATLRYRSMRQLFYSNYLTGSYQTATSSFDNSLQSTAASGTFEGNTIASASADVRSFPTESGGRIKILNIPRSSYGEQVSRRSFSLASVDGVAYNLVDDGNGNVVDALNNNTYVGNIIYAQGFVIITNPNYYCVVDGGPTTFPKSYVFDIIDIPKTFNPILDAIPDCAPVVSSSLVLAPFPGYNFPTWSKDVNGNVTLDENDPVTNNVGIYKDLYTMQSTYCGTSDALPVTVQIIDVSVTGLSVISIAPSPSPSLTPSLTPTPTITVTPTITQTATISVTPTVSVTPTLSSTPAVSVSVGSSPSPTVSSTPTVSVTPTLSMTPTVSASPPAQGFAITLNGRGDTTSLACGGAGEPIVYVENEYFQTSYNSGGLSAIIGEILYENIYLSSTVADAYASDTYGPNVHSLSSGVVGSLLYGC